jgi:hypothetical protein
MCRAWREGHARLGPLLFRQVTIELLDRFSYRLRDKGEPIRVVIAPNSEGVSQIGQDGRTPIRV